MSNYTIGLSGLRANNNALDVISNNIANSSTVGYKAGEYIFEDQFYKAINPLDPARAGQGTAKQNIRRLFNMGSVQESANTLDMAITGANGMFRLASNVDPDEVYYTRNGQFAISKETDPNFPKRSYIVNENGMYLTGYANQSGIKENMDDQWTSRLTMPPTELEPQTTTISTIAVNLDARTNTFLPTGKVPFNPDVPSSYNNKVSQTVYSADDNGGAHTLTLYYRRVDDQNMKVTYNGATFQYAASDVAKNILSADDANVILTNDTSDGIEMVTGANRKTAANGTIDTASTLLNVDNADDIQQYARIVVNGIDSRKSVSVVEQSSSIKTTTANATGVKQVDTLTLTGNYVAGDVVSATINGTKVDYTVQAGDITAPAVYATAAVVASKLAAAYGSSPMNATVPATYPGGATITFTAGTAGAAFTSATSVAGGNNRLVLDSAITITDGDEIKFFNPATTSAPGATSNGDTVTIATPNSEISSEQYVYKLVGGVVTQVTDAAGVPLQVKANNGTAITLTGAPGAALTTSDTLIFYNPVSYRMTFQDGTKVSMAGDLFSKRANQTFNAVTTKYEVYASLDNKFYNHNDPKYYSEVEFSNPVGDGAYNPIAEMKFWGGKNIDSVVTNPTTGLPTFESSVYLTGKVTTPGNTAESTDPDLIFKLDLTGTRNYATPFGVDQSTQDGRSVALLNAVSIDDEGMIVGTYGDGRNFIAGQLVLVNFAATNGLVPSGGNVFQSSYLSGDEVHPNVTVGKPGQKGLGGIRAGAVEGSNVDLANELVKLLIQQRMYSANSQSIRAFDDTLTTTIRMTGG